MVKKTMLSLVTTSVNYLSFQRYTESSHTLVNTQEILMGSPKFEV
jgi:hypothetical protein